MQFTYTHSIATQSSTMQAVYWNGNTNELVVHFWAGSVMKYSSFYSDDFRAFSNAMSKGRFYNSYIKGAFHGSKMDNDTQFVHYEDTIKKIEPETVEAEPKTSTQITVNIYVNGDPEAIAKAVERFAPSVRALENWRG